VMPIQPASAPFSIVNIGVHAEFDAKHSQKKTERARKVVAAGHSFVAKPRPKVGTNVVAIHPDSESKTRRTELSFMLKTLCRVKGQS
jgi:hypothetical protein